MDLRRLNHVVALADLRHFGRAAEHCHLSQPAFSRSILAAEDELGLLLFNRGTPEITCTDAGAFVVERARKLIFDSRCMERDVSMYREREIGDIAFGIGPYPATTLLLDLLCELRTHYPGINTRVEVNHARYLTEHLRNETLDFFIGDMRNVVPAPDLEMRPLGQLEAGFYVRAGHSLAGTPTTVAHMLRFGLASVHVPEALLVGLGQIAGLPQGTALPMVVTCDDMQVLKGLALRTDTVIACPVAGMAQHIAGPEARAGARAVVPDDFVALQVKDMPPAFADVGLVSLRGRSLSPMAEFAVSFLAAMPQLKIPVVALE